MIAQAELEKINSLKRRLDEYKRRLDRSLLVDARELSMSIADQMAQLGKCP
jgi:division protein CdvB (Snf7/Vps24/ESCRT-III family)